MSCPSLSYQGVSQAQFDALKDAANRAGINIDGDDGSATAHGATVNWKYSPEVQILVLTCLSKPFFISCDHVNGELDKMVKGVLNVNPSPTNA